MDQETEKLSIIRVDEKGKSRRKDVVVKELLLTLYLNDRELATLSCSPTNVGYLAVGFLLSRGLIKSRKSLQEIYVDVPQGVVRVKAEEERLTGKPSSPPKVVSDIEISASEALALVDEFVQRSELFKATGGVHSAALCDRGGIRVFGEDISRHNAIDKVFGQCLLEGMATAGHLLITSGRVSSEVVLKVARRDVPLLISTSAPTDLGIRLARKLGLTLVGFAREKRMNLYANERRVKTD